MFLGDPLWLWVVRVWVFFYTVSTFTRLVPGREDFGNSIWDIVTIVFSGLSLWNSFVNQKPATVFWLFILGLELYMFLENKWNLRKKIEKALGRVKNLGHRLAVVND